MKPGRTSSLRSSLITSSSPHNSGLVSSPLGIADSGCSGHYIQISTPHSNRKPNSHGLTVELPDGNIIRSTHTADLIIPTLPNTACHAHIFSQLHNKSLISIGQLCDAGCTAIFSVHDVVIMYKGNKILSGYRDHSTRLWILYSPVSSSSSHSCSPTTTIFHNANYAANTMLSHLPTLAKFYHRACFRPTTSTFTKAIKSIFSHHGQASPPISSPLTFSNHPPP